MNKGFTLIELLVVVLIIGILAAIALPQYTKAVERSRMAEAVQKLGDLATAQSIFYMQNNDFAEGVSGADATKKYLNNGDITFAVAEFPLEKTTGKQWHFIFHNSSNWVAMGAVRDGGMYDGGTVAIRVDASGEITKACVTDSTPAGFCSVAKTMGFGNGSAEEAFIYH